MLFPIDCRVVVAFLDFPVLLLLIVDILSTLEDLLFSLSELSPLIVEFRS